VVWNKKAISSEKAAANKELFKIGMEMVHETSPPPQQLGVPAADRGKRRQKVW